jgi:LysM domain
MRHRRRDTLEALWWMTVMLVGLPVGLLHVPGRPTLPRHLPHHDQWIQLLQQPMTNATMIAGMVVAGWILWAVLVYFAGRDLLRWAAYLARRLPRMRLPGPLQTLSATVLGAVAVTSSTTGAAHAAVHSRPAPTSTGPGPLLRLGADTRPATPILQGSARPRVGTPGAAEVRPVSLVVRVGDRHYTYTVRRGDTLWHLASEWLGDPQRWPEIYHLNRGRYDQHGRMRHGDHIEPGWVLVLPPDAIPPAAAAPTRPATGSSGPAAAHPQAPAGPTAGRRDTSRDRRRADHPGGRFRRRDTLPHGGAGGGRPGQRSGIRRHHAGEAAACRPARHHPARRELAGPGLGHGNRGRRDHGVDPAAPPVRAPPAVGRSGAGRPGPDAAPAGGHPGEARTASRRTAPVRRRRHGSGARRRTAGRGLG